MEFENNTPVSDAERQLAETKKVTLQPIHPDVAPDDLPDAEQVAQHLNQGAVANAPNDIEEMSAVIQPSRSQTSQVFQTSHGRTKGSTFALAIVAVVGTIIAVVAFTK